MFIHWDVGILKQDHLLDHWVGGYLSSASGQHSMRTRLQADTRVKKPRQRVSNADRKVFANPESFCDNFIILLAEEFPDTLQYKISRSYEKCPDELESFRTILKVSG